MTTNLDDLLGGLPPILSKEEVADLVGRLLSTHCRPLVFYSRDDVAAILCQLSRGSKKTADQGARS